MSIQKTLSLHIPVVALHVNSCSIKNVLHSVISEQTAIISIHIINCLVFIIKLECSRCAVQNESLSEITTTVHLIISKTPNYEKLGPWVGGAFFVTTPVRIYGTIQFLPKGVSHCSSELAGLENYGQS